MLVDVPSTVEFFSSFTTLRPGDVIATGFRERLYDDKGQLRQFINIYRNDEDIRFGSGLKTQLSESDYLSIVPAVAGG